MEGMMDSSAVTLVVKTPNRSMEDLQISCALNWTVEKIKKHLSSVYPSKPESKKQRLIYSGQLLLDHQTVKDFLREHQDGQLHTVHLVCPPSSHESSSPSTSSSTKPSSASPMTTSSTPSTPTQSTTQPIHDGLRYRGQNTPPLPMYMPSPPMWPMNAQSPIQAPMVPPNFQPHMNHQLWMQHMQQMFQQHQMAAAARQPQANFMYMPPHMQMPHMPYWPYQRPVGMPPATPPVTTPPPSPQQPAPAQQVAPPPQPQPRPQAPNAAQGQAAQARNQEVRMNAQGGVANDDEDEENPNNDWLDKIYTLCRVAILLSIVWFYSSTGRFLMLIISVVSIYMYQWGVFRWLFQNQQQPVNNLQPQVQQEEQNQEETDETDNTEEGGESNSDEDVTTTQDSETQNTETVEQPPAPPPGPSPFRVAVNFVSTFFTSLVPQHNEVFQGN